MTATKRVSGAIEVPGQAEPKTFDVEIEDYRGTDVGIHVWESSQVTFYPWHRVVWVTTSPMASVNE